MASLMKAGGSPPFGGPTDDNSLSGRESSDGPLGGFGPLAVGSIQLPKPEQLVDRIGRDRPHRLVHFLDIEGAKATFKIREGLGSNPLSDRSEASASEREQEARVPLLHHGENLNPSTERSRLLVTKNMVDPGIGFRTGEGGLISAIQTGDVNPPAVQQLPKDRAFVNIPVEVANDQSRQWTYGSHHFSSMPNQSIPNRAGLLGLSRPLTIQVDNVQRDSSQRYHAMHDPPRVPKIPLVQRDLRVLQGDLVLLDEGEVHADLAHMLLPQLVQRRVQTPQPSPSEP